MLDHFRGRATELGPHVRYSGRTLFRVLQETCSNPQVCIPSLDAQGRQLRSLPHNVACECRARRFDINQGASFLRRHYYEDS